MLETLGVVGLGRSKYWTTIGEGLIHRPQRYVRSGAVTKTAHSKNQELQTLPRSGFQLLGRRNRAATSIGTSMIWLGRSLPNVS
jgi:hypothetical protein